MRMHGEAKHVEGSPDHRVPVFPYGAGTPDLDRGDAPGADGPDWPTEGTAPGADSEPEWSEDSSPGAGGEPDRSEEASPGADGAHAQTEAAAHRADSVPERSSALATGGARRRWKGTSTVPGRTRSRSEGAPHRAAADRAELEGSLAELVDRLSVALERSNVLDYTILLQHPWRMVWINFVGGAARGVGIGIGFTVLTAVLLYILRGLMMANLPVIGDLIATIVRLVEHQLRP